MVNNHRHGRGHMKFEFLPWVGKTPWRRKWQSTPVSVLAWRIPPTEEPGGLQSTGSKRDGRSRATEHTDFLHVHLIKEEKELWSGMCTIL